MSQEPLSWQLKLLFKKEQFDPGDIVNYKLLSIRDANNLSRIK